MPARMASGRFSAVHTLFLAGDHQTGHDAERDLRRREPPPVDALVQQRIHERNHVVEQAGPEQRRDDSAQNDRPAGQHRQHRAVEKSDKQRRGQVHRRREEKPVQTEVQHLVDGGNGGRRVQTSREQIDRIPDAAVREDAVEHRQQRHGHAAGEAALHAGGDRIDLERQPGARRSRRDSQTRRPRRGGTTATLAGWRRRPPVRGARAEAPGETIRRAPTSVEHRSQDADRSVGEQPRKDQRDAQRQDERPRRRRRHHDDRRLPATRRPAVPAWSGSSSAIGR